MRCVPLFWLQTEDHDFAEVASVTVAGADGAPRRLTVPPGPSRPARSSIAHTHLGPEIAETLATLADLLGDSPPAADTVGLLARHYRAGRTMAEAFAGTMAELFADEGLLFCQPRDARIAQLAAPIHRQALTGAEAIEQLLSARAAELNAAGFDAQIPVRPGCALSFFHPDGPAGDRFRVARDQSGARWGLSGRAISLALADLEAALERTPLCFSTSALLRPILQDSVVPDCRLRRWSGGSQLLRAARSALPPIRPRPAAGDPAGAVPPDSTRPLVADSPRSVSTRTTSGAHPGSCWRVWPRRRPPPPLGRMGRMSRRWRELSPTISFPSLIA